MLASVLVMDGRQSLSFRWLLLLTAAPLVILPALYHPLASFDEAWYAAVARNIRHTGDWLSLTYNGEHYWDKPPILIWLTAACYRLFGQSEFVTRLPAMAASFACLLVVYQFARLHGGRQVGLLAGLLLLTAQDFVRFSAKGQMDVPIALLVTAQL